MGNKYKTVCDINENGVAEYGIETLDGAIRIRGISTDKNAIDSLTESFNRFELSNIHLHEAVDDFVNT